MPSLAGERHRSAVAAMKGTISMSKENTEPPAIAAAAAPPCWASLSDLCRCVMRAIGYVTVTVLAIVYAQILNGWALSLLWTWFVVPTFDCAVLTIPAAIGIASVVRYLTNRIERKKEQQPFGEMLAQGFIIATIKPMLALAFGLVVRCFM